MRESVAVKTWKALLAPMASDYEAMQTAIMAHCESLDDDGLSALGDAATKPTQTNCWWATYAVAPVVAEEVKRVQYDRQRAARASAIGNQP